MQTNLKSLASFIESVLENGCELRAVNLIRESIEYC